MKLAPAQVVARGVRQGLAPLPESLLAAADALLLGIGVTGLYFPDYPGSDQSSPYVLPFPYFVYRGEILKADRHGLRGVFFDTDRIELNLSLGASLPVKSDDNRARQGMPDLQPTVELGPSIDIHLWRTANRRYQLDLRLPVRMAVTASGGVDDIGWVFSPRLNLGWDLGSGLGLRAGYGEAFRQPSVGELYFPNSGNPDLALCEPGICGAALRQDDHRLDQRC